MMHARSFVQDRATLREFGPAITITITLPYSIVLCYNMPPLTIKYCRIVSRPPMLKLNTAL